MNFEPGRPIRPPLARFPRARRPWKRPRRIGPPWQVRRAVYLLAHSAALSERDSDIAALIDCWNRQACWICGLLGPCAHREPMVDLARMEAMFGGGESR